MSSRVTALLGGVRNAVTATASLLRPRHMKPHPWTILVTGASTGIGLAIARQLIERTQHHVIVTAREASLDRLEAEGIAPSARVWLRALDVTDADQRRQVVSEAIDAFGAVDAVINNAAQMTRSVVEHVTVEERLQQTDVNFLAPLALTRMCLPAMRQQRFGRVINISSVGGMSAMPTMAAYSASKYALEGASEALWYEVRPWNVRVSLIQPGFIRSNAFRNVRFTQAGRASLADATSPYHEHYTNMEELTARLMQLTWATPDSVARSVVRTLHRRRPPLRVAGTCDAWLFSVARRLLPQWAYHTMLYAGLPRVWRWGGSRRE